METSLFGGRDENRPADSKKNVGVPSPGMQKLNESVNETGSRLAVLEERMANLRKKSQLIEHSLLSYEKETRTDLKALTETMLDLARKVEEVKEKIDAMNGELSSVVKKHELMVLERYMDLWQPLSFVTRDEAKMLLKEAMGKKRG